jgi:hypothetical protein
MINVLLILFILFVGVAMKPFVLKAQVKELNNYLKSIDDLNQVNLLETQKKLLKMQQEVTEYLLIM